MAALSLIAFLKSKMYAIMPYCWRSGGWGSIWEKSAMSSSGSQSPTYQQTNIHQRFGAPPKTPSSPAPSRIRGRSRSPLPPVMRKAAPFPRTPSPPRQAIDAGEHSPGEEETALQQQLSPPDLGEQGQQGSEPDLQAEFNVPSHGHTLLCLIRYFSHVPAFHVHEVQAFSPGPVTLWENDLDSGCQRSCCGAEWFRSHNNKLTTKFKLASYKMSCRDAFQFCKGSPLVEPIFQLVWAKNNASFLAQQCLMLLCCFMDLTISLPSCRPSSTCPRKRSSASDSRSHCHLKWCQGIWWQFPEHVNPHKHEVWQELSFGMNLIQIIFSRVLNSRTVLRLQLEKYLNKWLPPMLLAPPSWMRHWRRLVEALEQVNRQFLQFWPFKPIHHVNFKRYGNVTRRYAQCKACLEKWKWNVQYQTWQDFHGSASSSTRSPPLPSPSSQSHDHTCAPSLRAVPHRTLLWILCLHDFAHVPQLSSGTMWISLRVLVVPHYTLDSLRPRFHTFPPLVSQ